MKLVKTMPKYKCDFCNRRSTRATMELHEKRCYRNPNRFCDACDNTRFVDAGADVPGELPCPYCSKFDPKQLKEIEEREYNQAINEFEQTLKSDLLKLLKALEEV